MRRDGKSQSSVVDRRCGDPDAMPESPRGVNTRGIRTAEVTADISSGFNGAKTARRPLLVGKTAAMSTMEKLGPIWEQLEIAFCSLLIGRGAQAKTRLLAGDGYLRSQHPRQTLRGVPHAPVRACRGAHGEHHRGGACVFQYKRVYERVSNTLHLKGVCLLEVVDHRG